MAEEHSCPECGTSLDPEDPSGLCDRCLLELGLRGPRAENLPPGEPDPELRFLEPPQARVTQEDPGRYISVREHARGGMGRVLIAHDAQLERDVVIKELLSVPRTGSKGAQLPSPSHQSSAAVGRFLREARVTGQLQHPSIVPVYELGQRKEGSLYYTMKLVQGISLSEAIKKAEGLAERLKLLPHLLDACQAIAYAHSRGVIHRDIKPGNVMVGEFGETVLLDWGLAKRLGEAEIAHGGAKPASPHPADTREGQVLGTPAYMAPEQARGATDDVDERTDVFALGAVLYTLLTGKPPSEGDTWSGVLEQAIQGARAAVLSLEPEAPVELVAICDRALAENPEARYASAGELAAEMQQFLTGGLVSAYTYRFSEHLRRFVRRNRKLLSLAAAAATVLIILGVGAFLRIRWERDAALEARTEAEVERERATREEQTTKQVEAFLVDLLGTANPFGDPGSEARLTASRGRAVTVGEVLDLGSERIQDSLQDQPAIRARLMDTLGDVYRALADYDKALPLLEQSLETKRALYGEPHAEVASQLSRLARLHLDSRNMEVSKDLFEQALKMQTELHAGDHEDVAAALSSMGLWYFEDSCWGDAITWYQQALDMDRRLPTQDKKRIATLTMDIATAHMNEGNSVAAESLWDEALVMFRQLPANEGQSAPTILINKAILQNNRGDYDGAISLGREALEAQRRVYPEPHPLIARDLRYLADSMSRAGRFSEAESLFQESLRMLREMLGDEYEHPEVIFTLVDLGNTLRRKGDVRGAEQVYRDAVALGPKFDYWPRRQLADLLREEQQDFEVAVNIFQEGIALDRERPGGTNADIADLLYELGVACERMWALELAEEALRESIAIAPVNDGGSAEGLTPDTGAVIQSYAQVAKWRRGLDGAEAAIREAREVAREKLGSRHPAIGTYTNSLGHLLLNQANMVQAEAAFREAGRLGPEQETDDDKLFLAGLYAEEGDYGHAEKLLRDMLDDQLRRLGQGHVVTVLTYQPLADVLLRNEDYEALEAVVEPWQHMLPKWRQHPFHRDHGISLNTLVARIANIHLLKGDVRQAERWWERYIELVRELCGDDYPGVGLARLRLAVVLESVGYNEEAGRLREQVARTMRPGDAIRPQVVPDAAWDDVGFVGSWGYVTPDLPPRSLDVWREGNAHTAVYASATYVRRHSVSIGPDMTFSVDYYGCEGEEPTRFALKEDGSVEVRGTEWSPIIPRIEPTAKPRMTPEDLEGTYTGTVGYGKYEHVQVTMVLEVRDNQVTGMLSVPLGELSIVEGKRLPGSRLFLRVSGSGAEGLMIGTATPETLDFQYEIGFGTGEAHLKKLTAPAG